ncbi:unnamed protein product, partial [marine sediment metagenome]
MFIIEFPITNKIKKGIITKITNLALSCLKSDRDVSLNGSLLPLNLILILPWLEI